jgi:transposase
MRKNWTRKEKVAFAKMHNDGVLLKDIAVALGRSIRSIESMARNLRVCELIPRRRRHGSKWTEARDAMLIRLANEGLADWQIAERMGVSPDSVSHRAYLIRKKGKLVAVVKPYSGDDGGRITFKRLLFAVCGSYSVSTQAVLGVRRSSDVVKPRQVLMALAYRNTRLSYPQIGERLSRDHTTVLHGVRVAQEKFFDDISAIEAELFRESAE